MPDVQERLPAGPLQPLLGGSLRESQGGEVEPGALAPDLEGDEADGPQREGNVLPIKCGKLVPGRRLTPLDTGQEESAGQEELAVEDLGGEMEGVGRSR